MEPLLGEGAGRVFTFVFSHPSGGSAIDTVQALVATGSTVSGVNNCYFFAQGNSLWLRNDAHTEWLGPITAGTSTSVSNSQCAVFASGFSLTASGNNLTLTVPVTFAPSFAGAKTIYTRATDRAGVVSDLVQAGAWTAAALNPAFDVVTSSCADPASDPLLGATTSTEQQGRVLKFLVSPNCFPAYSNLAPPEGWFMENDRRPLPTMGRTCGHFDILVAFIDTDGNRRKLHDNADVPAAVKAEIDEGRIHDALTDLFATYTMDRLILGLTSKNAAKALGFTFSVATTTLTQRQLETSDGGLRFARHDAVLVLDNMGAITAHGIERWPGSLTQPLFDGNGGGFFLHIDPQLVTPAVFTHELLHRNVPWGLKEYLYGEKTLVVENGVTYDRTPIINPRTGENIEPVLRSYAGAVPIAEYIAGLADVDGDGVPDCIDPVITPTPDNVDGDFIPDRFDPDLTFNHRPYSWMYANRSR